MFIDPSVITWVRTGCEGTVTIMALATIRSPYVVYKAIVFR